MHLWLIVTVGEKIIRRHGLGKSKTSSWVGKIVLKHGPWDQCTCCLKPFCFCTSNRSRRGDRLCQDLEDARLMDPLSFHSHWAEIPDHQIIKSQTPKLVSEQGISPVARPHSTKIPLNATKMPTNTTNQIMESQALNRNEICRDRHEFLLVL